MTSPNAAGPDSRPDSGPATAPRWLRRLSQAGLIAAVVALVMGAWTTGVAWDETYHVMRMRSYLAHGWYVLPHELTSAGTPGEWASELYVYAPISMIALHALGLAAGVDEPGTVTATAEAFGVRHLGVAAIGVLGLVAVLGLASRVWGWRSGWPWVAGAVCASIGMWTGQAMFNIKDIPTATGFTVWTLGCATLVAAAVEPRRGWPASAGMSLLALGGILAVGTRPGIWAGLAAVAIAAAALSWLSLGRRGLLVPVGLAAATGVAWLVLWIAYRATFSDPVALLWGSVSESAHFKNESSPWWYVPANFALEMPTTYLVLAAVGVVSSAGLGWRRRLALPPAQITLWLCGVQALALPVLAMARESHLYTGTRQLLFVYPAASVLITAGVMALLERRSRRPLGPALAGVGIASGLLGQLLLFPYNYAYQSPVSLIAFGVDQTDWWRTSVRELAPAIPAGARVVCSPKGYRGAGPDERTVFLAYADESHGDCATALVGPLAPYHDRRSPTEEFPASQVAGPMEFYAVVTGRGDLGLETESNCRRIAQVERFVWWRREEMSAVSVCELVVADYPPGGIRFVATSAEQPANSRDFELGDFIDPHADRGKTLTERSLLGLRVPPKFGESAPWLAVELAGSGSQIPEVTINSQVLTPHRAAGRWRVRVPATAAVDGRLLVQLGPPGAVINAVTIEKESAQ